MRHERTSEGAADGAPADSHLIDALDRLSGPVTISVAVRDADGVAVGLRLAYRNAAARARDLRPPAGGTLAACLRVLNTGVAEQTRSWHAARLGTELLLWELRDTGADLRRADALARIASRLARTDAPEDVLGVMVTDGIRATGAVGVTIVVPAPAGTGFVAHSAAGAGPAEQRHVSRLDLGPPLASLLLDRTAGMDRPGAGAPDGRVALPMLVDDRVLGAVLIDVGRAWPVDEAERDFFTALVAQVTQALDRTLAHADAARAHVQLQALNDLSGRLGSATEPAQVFAALVETVVPRLADGVLIHQPRADARLALVAGTHTDEQRWKALRLLAEEFPVTLAPAGGVGAGAVTVMTPPVLDGLAGVGDRAALAALADGSWLATPLQDGADRFGMLTMVRDGNRPFTERDIPFASEWSHRAAVALARIRDAQRQREVAEDLQRGLVPRRLPTVPGLSFGARYLPGRRDLHVGGDFYDVFPTTGGRLAVAIGDVCGTGPIAASRTALVRHSTRAFARVMPDPAQVCAAANEALLEARLDGAFCSMAYAELELTGERVDVGLTLAGHPRPLLRRADGSTSPVGVSGTVLGVVAHPEYTVSRHRLARGDTLLFYTDGASERRNGDHFLGEDGLRRLLEQAPPLPADDLLEHVLASILGFGDRELADDLAMVAVQITGDGLWERSHRTVD